MSKITQLPIPRLDPVALTIAKAASEYDRRIKAVRDASKALRQAIIDAAGCFSDSDAVAWCEVERSSLDSRVQMLTDEFFDSCVPLHSPYDMSEADDVAFSLSIARGV